MLKILTLDIENSPGLAYIWNMFRENVSLDQLLREKELMSFAAKWLHEDDVMWASAYHHGMKTMVQEAHRLLDEADAVVGWNSIGHDIKHLNREFLYAKLPPPSPHKDIDLFITAKRQFKFSSNKMDHVAGELLRKHKNKTTFELWRRCLDNEKAAWDELVEYNIQDVLLTEGLYRRLLPWIKGHPNLSLYVDTDRPVCVSCGSDRLHSRGTYRAKTMKYRKYQCQTCGKWQRDRLPCSTPEEKAVTLTETA